MDVISLCVIDWRLVEIVLYILCFATAHQQNFIFFKITSNAHKPYK